MHPSSEKGRRSLCRLCGSIAPTLATEMDLAILPAGNLEGDLGIRPQYHMFVGSKAPWYTIADSLPQHAEYPPEFGALGMERGAVAPRAGIIEGSCLCGDVAYEITGPALRMWYCHCSRCRRGRSAAHAAAAAQSAGGIQHSVPEPRRRDGRGAERRHDASELRDGASAPMSLPGTGASGSSPLGGDEVDAQQPASCAHRPNGASCGAAIFSPETAAS